MATNPDIATDIALQNLLTDNQRKYGNSRKQQRPVPNSPRVLKKNRRNRYVVMNQKNTPSKFKNGYVPLQPVSVFSSSSSSPLGSPSSHRPRRRRTQRPQSSLSERTFRSKPNTRSKENRPIANSSMGSSDQKHSRGLRKSMTDRIVQTTDMWLPSLKNTNLSQAERPFLRPLNAIEQILNDEVVEPTATYLTNLRNFISSKLESSFPVRVTETYYTNQIEEIPEPEGDQVQRGARPEEGTSRHQRQLTERRQGHFPGENYDHESNLVITDRNGASYESSSPFWAFTQIGDLASNLLRRLNFGRFAFNSNMGGDVSLDDNYVEAVCHASPVAFGHDPPQYIVMSPCSSFTFGPPIKPYPPAKSGPQMIMTPISSMTCSNLLLSPGKEVYSTDTIDISDVQNENMRRVLRVRFTLNDTLNYGSDGTYASGFPKRRRRKTPAIVSPTKISPPSSCVLAYDRLDSYMLPLESGQTLQSPKPATSECYEKPNTSETFSEFEYQVL